MNTTQVAYITLPDLRELLDKLGYPDVDILMGFVEQRIKVLQTNSHLRNQCISRARAIYRSVCEQLSREEAKCHRDYKFALHDLEERRQKCFGRLKRELHDSLLANQKAIDAAISERRSAAPGSDRYCKLTDEIRTLKNQRTELRTIHLKDLDLERSRFADEGRAYRYGYEEALADFERRRRGAAAALDVALSSIDATADADLPALMEELQEKKGGEK